MAGPVLLQAASAPIAAVSQAVSQAAAVAAASAVHQAASSLSSMVQQRLQPRVYTPEEALTRMSEIQREILLRRESIEAEIASFQARIDPTNLEHLALMEILGRVKNLIILRDQPCVEGFRNHLRIVMRATLNLFLRPLLAFGRAIGALARATVNCCSSFRQIAPLDVQAMRARLEQIHRECLDKRQAYQRELSAFSTGALSSNEQVSANVRMVSWLNAGYRPLDIV